MEKIDQIGRELYEKITTIASSDNLDVDELISSISGQLQNLNLQEKHKNIDNTKSDSFKNAVPIRDALQNIFMVDNYKWDEDSIGKAICCYIFDALVNYEEYNVTVIPKLHGGSNTDKRHDDVCILKKQDNSIFSINCKTVTLPKQANGTPTYQIQSGISSVGSVQGYFVVMWKDGLRKAPISEKKLCDMFKHVEAVVFIDTSELKHYATANAFRINLETCDDDSSKPTISNPKRGQKTRTGFAHLRAVFKITGDQLQSFDTSDDIKKKFRQNLDRLLFRTK